MMGRTDQELRDLLDRISAERAKMKPGEYPEDQPTPAPDGLAVVAWRVYHDWENAPGEDYYIGPADNGSLDKAVAVRLSKENADRIVQAQSLSVSPRSQAMRKYDRYWVVAMLLLMGFGLLVIGGWEW